MSDGLEQPLKGVLLMGLRNSGKTSIHRVVFDGVDPHETQHQETTTRLTKVESISNGFVKFQMWDFPGQTDWINAGPAFNLEQFLEGCGAIIFVVDVADPNGDINDAHDRLVETITFAHGVDESIHFEVFLHKVDKLTPDAQDDVFRRISTSVNKEVQHLAEQGSKKPRLMFHLTSIYDYSIFKAFSVVVQKIVPQLPYLRAVSQMLVSNSRLNQAILFDTTSRVYVIAEPNLSPNDSAIYDLFVEALQLSKQLDSMFPGDEEQAEDLPENSLLAGGESQFSATNFSADTHALVKVGNGKVVYVKELTKNLAVVVSGEETTFVNRSLIDYNVAVFAQAVVELFSLQP